MEVPLGLLIGVVTALAGTCGVLYKNNLTQQKQVESLLSETKELMGSLAELVRSANGLMLEVNRTMEACHIEREAVEHRGNVNA